MEAEGKGLSLGNDQHVYLFGRDFFLISIRKRKQLTSNSLPTERRVQVFEWWQV